MTVKYQRGRDRTSAAMLLALVLAVLVDGRRRHFERITILVGQANGGILMRS